VGVIFTLDADTKSVITQALDDLITELGKPCRLEYPPKWAPCVNCVYDPIGNKSSNRWLSGGPMQFPNGQTCPMCNGVGQLATAVTEVITFLCAWEPRKFWFPIPNLQIRSPYSIVQTKGFLKDLPKIERANFLYFQTPIEGIARKKYKLFKEPGDPSNIIQNRYFVASWERVDS
jgi:hypothetical protein